MFNPPEDIRYLSFLRRLHRHMLFDWYMEIGCRTGRSFADVRSRTIAVDPYFRIDGNVIGTKPALHVFQQTSDAFFSEGFLRKMGVQLGFSFLDGMHLMEYLLRDFINTEAHSHPGGVIALHDCCPFSLEMTTRDVDQAPKDAWTGDVWKLIPILQRYRPDLRLTVLGCRPTGLVLVSRLNPENTILGEKYEEIIAEWRDLSLEVYDVARFYGAFDYTPCSVVQADGFALFEAVAQRGAASPPPGFVSP